MRARHARTFVPLRHWQYQQRGRGRAETRLEKVLMSTARPPGAEPHARRGLPALLAESLAKDDVYEGHGRQGQDRRHREGRRRHRRRPQDGGPRATAGFAVSGRSADLKVGDTVDVYVDRMENALGEAVLSRDKAAARKPDAAREAVRGQREGHRRHLQQGQGRLRSISTAPSPSCRAARSTSVRCAISGRSCTSHCSSRSSRWTAAAATSSSRALRARGDARRAARRHRRPPARGEIVGGLVKNVTDYGAFIDLGGIDGLLHVTDMAQRRVDHPSEILNVSDTVKVQIIRINPGNRTSASASA